MTTPNNRTISENSKVGLSAALAFETFLVRLGDLVAAERDAVGLPSHDLAFDAWLSDAEAARTAVIAAAEDVVFARCLTVADLRFRIIARDFEAMMLTSDPNRYAFNHAFLMKTGWLYSARGLGKSMESAATLLRACRVQFEQLFEMPDYAPETHSCAPALFATAA